MGMALLGNGSTTLVCLLPFSSSKLYTILSVVVYSLALTRRFLEEVVKMPIKRATETSVNNRQAPPRTAMTISCVLVSALRSERKMSE